MCEQMVDNFVHPVICYFDVIANLGNATLVEFYWQCWESKTDQLLCGCHYQNQIDENLKKALQTDLLQMAPGLFVQVLLEIHAELSSWSPNVLNESNCDWPGRRNDESGLQDIF